MADCNHPIQAGGMCAICGQVLSEAQTSSSISMMHDTESVTVSREEAERLDSQSTKHLLDQRKLALIVDLDQTIIHATVDPTVGEWLHDPTNPNFEALRGVGSFRLGMDGKAILEEGTGKKNPSLAGSKGPPQTQDAEGCWYYVKPRPGLANFLRSLSDKYELHVYTMGTRSYADCVCRLVDPDGSLFGTRILSRDENGSLVQKSLTRLFPMDTSMVVIIDDRGDVWQWSPNLIKVIPYDFFIGSGDINAGFLPAQTGPGSPSTADTSATSTQSTEATGAGAGKQGLEAPSSTSASNTEKLNDAAEQEEEEAADRAAKAKAAKSQKTVVSEQLDARPLARMQEELDEKLGVTSSGTSTPASEGVPISEDQLQSINVRTAGADSVANTGSTHELGATNQSPEAEAGTVETPPTNTAQPTQRPQPVLKDNDVELHRVQKILETIHQKWYYRWETAERAAAEGAQSDSLQTLQPVKPTVMDIISELKKEVLRNCELVFSSLIPLGGELEDSDYFWMAIEYGATCYKDLKKETTHLVAAKSGTAKVNTAQRQSSVNVVWPTWLHDSIARWAKQPEAPYRLPPATFPDDAAVSSSHPTDDELSLSDDFDFATEDGNSAGGGLLADGKASGRTKDSWSGHELDGINWAEADKELEEYLNGSDDEDADEDESRVNGNFSTLEDDDEGQDSYTTADHLRATSQHRGKRSRNSTPSTNGDVSTHVTPGKATSSLQHGAVPTSPSGVGKRRRVSDAEDPAPIHSRQDPDKAAKTATEIASSIPRSYPSSVASSTAGAKVDGEGDETAASFMRDLEDEIEAALEGGDSGAISTGGTGSATNSTAGD